MRRVVEATGVAIEWDVFSRPARRDRKVRHAPARPRSRVDPPQPCGHQGPHHHAGGQGVPQRQRHAAQRARPVRQRAPGDERSKACRRVTSDVDLVVVRENTEGMYVGIEHEVIAKGEAAEAIRIITRRATERVVRFAFEYARANGRKQVTAVHKANILKLTDGLFLRVAEEVAAEYPDIAFNDRIVDATQHAAGAAAPRVRRAGAPQPLWRHRQRHLLGPRRCGWA
jgi:isocitrate dehydrogenase (NAD+)